MRYISFLSGIGYAIPGAVIALALLSFANSQWSIPSLILLFWFTSSSVNSLSRATPGFKSLPSGLIIWDTVTKGSQVTSPENF